MVYNSRPLNRHQMSKNEVFPILYYSLVSNEHIELIRFKELIKFYFSFVHENVSLKQLSSRTIPDSVFNDFVDSNLREPDEFPKTVSFPSFLTSKTVALGSSCIVLKSVFKYLFMELKTCSLVSSITISDKKISKIPFPLDFTITVECDCTIFSTQTEFSDMKKWIVRIDFFCQECSI